MGEIPEVRGGRIITEISPEVMVGVVREANAGTSGGRWLKVAGRSWTRDSASRTGLHKRRHVPSAGGCGQGRLSFLGNGGGGRGEEVNIDKTDLSEHSSEAEPMGITRSHAAVRLEKIGESEK